MKFIIALALFAVAFADDVQVVHLPEAPAPAYEMPDISPAWVPQAVLDAVKIAQPVLRDIEIDDSLKVQVVDAPISAPLEDAEEVLKVQFVDAPLDLPAPVAEEAFVPQPVQIADAPLPTVVEPVKIGAPHFPGKQYDDARLR